jgi:hypothetical protein
MATVNVAALTYSISASPNLSFGSVEVGYGLPATQNVTVTNTGTGAVALLQITANMNYDIGTVSTANLAPGATATFTVRPKADLPVGNHDLTITISGTNSTSASVNVEFTVTAATTSAPVFTTHPQNTTITAGNTATFTVVVTGSPAPTLQWQVSFDNGLIWSDFLIDGTNATFTTGTLPSGWDGALIRCVATNTINGVTNTVYSDVATITVNAPPAFTTHPQDVTAGVGQQISFTVVATGNPSPTLQWQWSSNNGATWVNSTDPGANTATLTVNDVNAGFNGIQIRCRATNVIGGVTNTVYSNVATITVNAPPAFTTPPQSVAINERQEATLTVVVTGNPTPTLQWEYSDDGITWDNCSGGSGATTDTYRTGGMSMQQSGKQFRCVATNSAGVVTSSVATVTVNPLPGSPVITTPAGALPGGTVGTPYSVTLSATNSPTGWTGKGSFPPGLTLSDSGVISGTPTTAGDYTFKIDTRNAIGGSGYTSFSISIAN